MPVAVGFDYRADGYRFSDVFLHYAEVFAQGAQRNLRPSAGVEEE
jgi:hypothetical protein